ncbi:hypothetical protein [Actinoallomurus sp. CA-150999]|uniref:hypothetical protein n=1 Tax=Actinoallomurus sp. CA-150999 TaxID=3239887 RepID=UPI003D8F3BBE
MTIRALQVEVSHGQYILQGPDAQLGNPVFKGGNGLVWAGEGTAVVMTGQDDGTIALTIDTLAVEPEPSLEGWDDVVDTSITITGDTLTIYGPVYLDDATVIPLPATTAQTGTYRLRVHVRGRDEGREAGEVYADEGEQILEHHLVLIWPAPHAPDTPLKLTDGVGAEIRART